MSLIEQLRDDLARRFPCLERNLEIYPPTIRSRVWLLYIRDPNIAVEWPVDGGFDVSSIDPITVERITSVEGAFDQIVRLIEGPTP